MNELFSISCLVIFSIQNMFENTFFGNDCELKVTDSILSFWFTHVT